MIFNVLVAQSCLMVAIIFIEYNNFFFIEYNNFYYSRSIFMISEFNFFPKMLLRDAEF